MAVTVHVAANPTRKGQQQNTCGTKTELKALRSPILWGIGIAIRHLVFLLPLLYMCILKDR